MMHFSIDFCRRPGAAAGEALANQKLRSSAGQSEAGTGIGTTGDVTGFALNLPSCHIFLNSVLFNSMFLEFDSFKDKNLNQRTNKCNTVLS